MSRSRDTLYRDVLFKSRLEAQWAAFFDLLGWPWIYEPSSLIPHARWKPDFLLREMRVLVKVIPINQNRIHSRLDYGVTIVDQYESIVVGCYIPFPEINKVDGVPIGYMLGKDRSWQPGIIRWSENKWILTCELNSPDSGTNDRRDDLLTIWAQTMSRIPR